MNLFFELSPAVNSEHKHFAAINAVKPLYGSFPLRYHGMAAASDRIWLEDETGVKFVKHRWKNQNTEPVDPEEFMMIKLKSKQV